MLALLQNEEKSAGNERAINHGGTPIQIFYGCNNFTQYCINGDLMNQEVWSVTKNGVGTSFVCFVCRTSSAGTFGAKCTFESINHSVLSP